jgi:hypothetical protein
MVSAAGSEFAAMQVEMGPQADCSDALARLR